MTIIDWWKNLPFENKELDKYKGNKLFLLGYQRKKPLSLKQLFFRDKLAVIGNFVPLIILIFVIIKEILT